MTNNRNATLAALAQQALDQYRTDIATGEPVFPQWALDMQHVLAMNDSLAKIARKGMIALEMLAKHSITEEDRTYFARQHQEVQAALVAMGAA